MIRIKCNTWGDFLIMSVIQALGSFKHYMFYVQDEIELQNIPLSIENKIYQSNIKEKKL